MDDKLTEPGSSGQFWSWLGGASSGTGLAGGGLEAGADTTLGKIMLLVSPTVAVVMRSVVLYVHVEVRRRLEARQAAKARKVIQAAIDNPRLPEPARERLRETLAAFEHSLVARELARVGLVGTMPPEDEQGSSG